MDENTRMIIAYATLLFGIPVLAAKIAWFIPGAISGVMLTQVADKLDELTDALIEGFISLLFTGLFFERLDLQVNWKVPVLLIIITSLWHWAKGEAFKALPSVAGIIAAFTLSKDVVVLCQSF